MPEDSSRDAEKHLSPRSGGLQLEKNKLASGSSGRLQIDLWSLVRRYTSGGSERVLTRRDSNSH